MSVYNLSLANYLANSSSANYFNSQNGKSNATVTEKIAAIYQEKTSFLTKNADGKYSMPTAQLLDEAVTPLQKLQAAYKVASATKVYTDAAAQTGIVTRLSSMTDQVEKVTEALGSAVAGLQDSGSLKSSLGTIKNTLGTLQTIFGQMNNLSGKLPSTEASSLKSKLSTLDACAKIIAEAASIKYTSPLTGKSSGSTSSVQAKTNRLVDYLA